ncbi:MAPK-interacting and spindle-stabilizing protein-like [Gallus gallus]|uniref:MAPK-interacting and spindle-stabilizing protein-like n=1 Tax=Gallus gallus TaxID=9031 RepID=UPI001F0047D3|nr:MAPK-interacting and spindle-stabilizing protein-like [Gallus gallus]
MARGPQPGLVRFGPVSSAGPGPVWSPQSGSLDPLPSAGPGSVPSAQFCPFGPVLSPPLAGPSPLNPVLSPWPSSVLSARFCHLGLAPSAQFCLLSPVLSPQSAPFSPARLRPFGPFLSLSLSPFRPVPVPSARFCPFGPVLLARFLQLSTSGRAAAGPPSRAAHSWDTAGSRRQLQAGTPQPDTASRDPREQQTPPPKKGNCRHPQTTGDPDIHPNPETDVQEAGTSGGGLGTGV